MANKSCQSFPLAAGQISHLTQSSKAGKHAKSCQWFPLAAGQISHLTNQVKLINMPTHVSGFPWQQFRSKQTCPTMTKHAAVTGHHIRAGFSRTASISSTTSIASARCAHQRLFLSETPSRSHSCFAYHVQEAVK